MDGLWNWTFPEVKDGHLEWKRRTSEEFGGAKSALNDQVVHERADLFLGRIFLIEIKFGFRT